MPVVSPPSPATAPRPSRHVEGRTTPAGVCYADHTAVWMPEQDRNAVRVPLHDQEARLMATRMSARTGARSGQWSVHQSTSCRELAAWSPVVRVQNRARSPAATCSRSRHRVVADGHAEVQAGVRPDTHATGSGRDSVGDPGSTNEPNVVSGSAASGMVQQRGSALLATALTAQKRRNVDLVFVFIERRGWRAWIVRVAAAGRAAGPFGSPVGGSSAG